jgi:Uma2 family endonuclease
MRVVMLDAPQKMLDERRRLGHDRRDEMWDGVRHQIPPPGGPHQRLSSALHRVLAPIAELRDLVPHMETGLFRADDDYRVPDQLYCRPGRCSERGAEGAEFLVEVRSPDDDTYAKIPFYEDMGVRELLVVHPADRRIELLRNVGGELRPLTSDAEGAVRSDVLGVRFVTVAGRLRLTWADGTAEL